MKKVLILLLALSLTGCSSITKTAATKGEVVDCTEISHVATKPGDTLLNCLTGSQKISVESLHGPLIVNVWGSWCGPCADEIPLFVDFNHHANGKVKLLGIAVEEAKAQDSKDFIIANGITWPNLYDAKGVTRSTFGMGVPVTWFIDEQGTVVYKHIGVVKSTDELIDLTNKYLKVSI
ncbi:MAG: TlpA disulfide reductase family protein [Actinobacteria bacterium]|nr:TlpA disulfide reductase family protein [Actinomycetota bacterium]